MILSLTVPVKTPVKRNRAARVYVEGFCMAFVGNASTHLSFLSSLPPVPCREDLAPFAQNLFWKTGNAAEVGVFQGDFSRHNLQFWKGHYYAIDAWDWRPSDNKFPRNDKNFKSDQINVANMEMARKNTRAFGARVQLLRALSENATLSFTDNFFDWVYIDALHTKEALLADLRAWWPKVRPGGLVSGDDYGDHKLPPLAKMHVNQPGTAIDPMFWSMPANMHWGVMRATSHFAEEVGATLHVGWLHGNGLLGDRVPTCYLWPHWYMVKPYADENDVALARVRRTKLGEL